MLFNFGLLTTLLAAAASASPLASSSNDLAERNQDITRLGSVGTLLSGGTSYGGLVFVSGQVPTVNNTIVPGGIKNETRVCLEKIGAILKEAGTDWSRVLKVTVLMQGQCFTLTRFVTRNLHPHSASKDINDFAAMNEVYTSMLPK